MTTPTVILILGGARSGKSAFAERLIGSAANPVYLATGQPLDDEMRDRIEQHRRRRGGHWTTLEEPLRLTDAISRAAAPDRPVLVDCLTLWLSNLLLAGHDLQAETGSLLTLLAAPPGPVILVSNEVGLGVVPEHRLGREFRDHAGQLHQAIAELAQQVYLLVAGQPLTVKDVTAANH